MNFDRLVTFISIGFLLIIGMFIWWAVCPASAEFFLKALTSIGIITTVAFALYGDFLREWFYPVTLRIELLSEKEVNSEADTIYKHGFWETTYSHHLKVVNLSKKKKVESCRVWMKRLMVTYPMTAGKPHDEFVMAAPRLMEWTPSEINGDVRTFISDQIFDLGKTTKDGFEFNIHKDQIHAVNLLKEKKDKFRSGATIVCSFYATADNYHEQREFFFQITAYNLNPLTSKVNALDKWPAPAPIAVADFSVEG